MHIKQSNHLLIIYYRVDTLTCRDDLRMIIHVVSNFDMFLHHLLIQYRPGAEYIIMSMLKAGYKCMDILMSIVK